MSKRIASQLRRIKKFSILDGVKNLEDALDRKQLPLLPDKQNAIGELKLKLLQLPRLRHEILIPKERKSVRLRR